MSDGSVEAQQFAAALQESYPRMWSGATMQTFPLEKYLAFANEASDDGGPIAVALPRSSTSSETASERGNSVEVFDGAEDLQRMVSYPLSNFLAIVANRSANTSSSNGCCSSSSHSSHSSSSHSSSSSTHEGSLYGCQIPLAGSGAPSPASGGGGNGALRQALAAGARACVPEWATVAIAAADAAIEATAASTTAHCNEKDDDQNNDGESEAASSTYSGATSSINAWLCAGQAEGGNSGKAPGAMMRTEAHFDGYHNFMCVLEGRKVVELWPPGTPNLTRRAPAWVHHVPPPSQESHLPIESTEATPSASTTATAVTAAMELPPAPEVLVLNGGDVGFWPEGWWHRVTSLPATRAVNIWWSGARPFLAQTLPSAEVPYALRLLAHRAAELRIAEWTEEQRKADAKVYRAEKASIPKGCTWKLPSDAESSYPRRYPMLCLAAKVTDSSSLETEEDDEGSSARKRARVDTSFNKSDLSEGQNEGDGDDDTENNPSATEAAEFKAWGSLLQDWALAPQDTSACEYAATPVLERLQRALRLGSVTPSALLAAATTVSPGTSNGCGDADATQNRGERSTGAFLPLCMAWARLIVEGIDDLTAHVSAERWAQQDRWIQQDRQEAGAGGGSSSTASAKPLEEALFYLHPEVAEGNEAATAAMAEAKRVFALKKERLARLALSSAVEDFTGIAAPAPT